MIDKNCIDIFERLRPMCYDALERLSFGLTIVSREMVFVPRIPTSIGPMPGFGCIYQARGSLIGTENYVANMSVFTSPFVTQEAIDIAISEGCEILRNQRQAQTTIANGGR
jgi:hypothetical protein